MIDLPARRTSAESFGLSSREYSQWDTTFGDSPTKDPDSMHYSSRLWGQLIGRLRAQAESKSRRTLFFPKETFSSSSSPSQNNCNSSRSDLFFFLLPGIRASFPDSLYLFFEREREGERECRWRRKIIWTKCSFGKAIGIYGIQILRALFKRISHVINLPGFISFFFFLDFVFLFLISFCSNRLMIFCYSFAVCCLAFWWWVRDLFSSLVFLFQFLSRYCFLDVCIRFNFFFI